MEIVWSEKKIWYTKLYVRMKNEAPKQNMNHEPKTMLRFLRIRGGIVALSPCHTCTPAKAVPSIPARTKSAMILPIRDQRKSTPIISRLQRQRISPSFQWYFDPPHCKASKRHIIQGKKMIVPTGSNCFVRSQKPIEFSCSRGGEVKNSAMPTIVTAPMGRLM